MSEPTNGNGMLAKAIAGVASIAAVIGILGALLSPIYSSLNVDREERKILRDGFAKLIETMHDDGKAAQHLAGYQEKTIERLQADVQELERSERELREIGQRNSAGIINLASVAGNKFTEVETQFNWLRNVMNMRDRQGNFVDAIMWREMFKHPLPQPTMPDAGPGAAGENTTTYGLLNGH